MCDAWAWAWGRLWGMLSERTTTQDGCLVLSTPTLRVVNDLSWPERDSAGGWIYGPSEKRTNKRGIWTKGKKIKNNELFRQSYIYFFPFCNTFWLLACWKQTNQIKQKKLSNKHYQHIEWDLLNVYVSGVLVFFSWVMSVSEFLRTYTYFCQSGLNRWPGRGSIQTVTFYVIDLGTLLRLFWLNGPQYVWLHSAF